MNNLMMKYFACYVLLFLLLGSCSTDYEVGDKDLIQNVKEIPWDLLKEDPSKYNNDTLLISGEFHYNFEDVSINKDSKGIWINSFVQAVGDKEIVKNLHNRDIEVYGLFNSKDKGHLGQYLGTIEKIYYLRTR